jgi:hypothetical protein
MLALNLLTTLLLTLISSSTAFSIPSLSSLTTRATICSPPKVHTPPSGRARFELLAIPISGNGNLTIGGTWLSSAHNGAGSAAPVLTTNQSLAGIWNFNTKRGDIYFNGGKQFIDNKTVEIPYSLLLYSGALLGTDAPTGSLAVGIYIGEGNSNFTFDAVTNEVSPPCGTFAACYVNMTVPYAPSPGGLLVWHRDGEGQGVNCVDVALKAVHTF